MLFLNQDFRRSSVFMNKKKLLHTAKLANLYLSPKEQDEFTHQLGHVLEHFSKISKINTKGVLPLTHPLEGLGLVEGPLREDKPNPPSSLLKPSNILALAPETLGKEYKVPPVVE